LIALVASCFAGEAAAAGNTSAHHRHAGCDYGPHQ